MQTVAQEMKVLSFVRAETDMTATNNRVLDVNDRVCALIKVETSESGISFTFGTSQIVKREEQNTEHPSEIWLYVPSGVTKVTIQKADYPVIRDYPLSEMLQSGRTYIMKITTDKIVSYVESSVTGQFVSFVVSPSDAYLEFDGKPLQLKNGQTSTANPVPFGIYSYKVEAENYHSENGKVDVNDPDNSIVVNVTLKPAYGSLDVSGESVRGGTVYLDKKSIGIAPVSLEIVPSGRHTIKVAKDMYNPYEAEIEINDGKKTTVSPIMQPNFQNITFKVDGNAEIWINGKLRGTGSVKDDFEAGTLFVECKKENHRTTSANYSSVAGALPTTIPLASPIPIYGVLLVKSNPIGADVFVDGENKGKTPRQLAQTIIGSHRVRILKEGYLSYEETVTILEGQSLTVETDLTEKERTYINATPISINLSHETALRKIEISTNAKSWKVANKPSWCTISNTTITTLTIDVGRNYASESRNGTIELETDDGIKCSVQISQLGSSYTKETTNNTQRKSPVSTYFGLNLGIGYQGNAAFQNLNGSLGIDLAWGRYYNAYGLFLSYRSIDNISFGPMFILNHFIMGVGANVNIGRNVYSGLPDGVQSRRVNMGYDGIIRLGGKFGRVYMFAEGGLGQLNGADNFYNEVTQSTESHKWSKLNWTTSLGLGVQLNGSSNNWYKSSKTPRVKFGKTKKSEFVMSDYYDNIGGLCITWVKAYGFCGLLGYDKGDYEVNFGGSFDFLAFRLKMFEISLASFGYDEYVGGWDWTPRLRLNIPIWDSGSLFADLGMHMWHLMAEEFFLQVGVQWYYLNWNYMETFIRYGYDFDICNPGYAISIGISFGLCTGAKI